MKASIFSIIYVLLGGLLLMFGTPIVATLGLGGVLASVIIGVLYFGSAILIWNKFGIKE